MYQTINIQEIKDKLYEKLIPSGWAIKLRSFIFSSDFDDILLDLVKQAQEGKRFTPTIKNIFRAFEECPYEKLKVIIIGQDPYPQIGVADGIAFSCSNTMELQPSLEYMFKEIEKTIYSDDSIESNRYFRNPDLKYLSNQGILMLNTALTTNVGKIGQHYLLWKPFLAYLFDFLTWNNNGLVYVYMGKKAQEWIDAVNDNNYKFKCTHPASAAYRNDFNWDSNDVFNEINKVLKKNYGSIINW